jgi:hypothetical protein
MLSAYPAQSILDIFFPVHNNWQNNNSLSKRIRLFRAGHRQMLSEEYDMDAATIHIT